MDEIIHLRRSPRLVKKRKINYKDDLLNSDEVELFFKIKRIKLKQSSTNDKETQKEADTTNKEYLGKLRSRSNSDLFIAFSDAD